MGKLPESYLVSLINEIIDYDTKISNSLLFNNGLKILIISD